MFLYLTNVPSRTIHTRQTKNRKCETQEQNFQRAADDVIFSNGRNNKFLPRQYTYLVHQYHCKTHYVHIHSVYSIIKIKKTREH